MSPQYAAEWLRKAEADCTAAKACFRLSRRFKDQAEIACFHAQQCAEKYLKGLLALAGIIVPRTRDLEVLAGIVEKPPPQLLLLADLERLNAYAVEIRYPGTTATRAEAIKALAAMERIRKACRNSLKAENPRAGALPARRPR